ncbi:hypothetical protein V7128_05390 [Neobacillus vireti]|uniref:hypothetical protein n=1 Tax=Neobacillus vireti TaxID=220686 RepID=UPI002FFFEE45
MENWSYIKDTFLTAGITEEGLPFFEHKLQGWNDDKSSNNKEDIVVVQAIIYDEGAEVLLRNIYISEEAMNDPLIRQKGEEIEQNVLQEVNLWLHGAN